MPEDLLELRKELLSRSKDKLPHALVRAAAQGLALRDSVPEWIEHRLSTEQLAEAHMIADNTRAYMDAISHDDSDLTPHK